MIWWKHLYMGDKASAWRPQILEGIRLGRKMPGIYVITPPASGNHIFDIRPVSLLAEEERRGETPLILGTALGYSEACQVVRQMVDDMYRSTDAFDWQQYMDFLEAR